MVLYFAAMLTIGFIYSKRSNSSTKQYFAGGRGVGPWLTALSAEASDMSGWLLMGLPGVAYFTGAADPMWTAIGLALGTYLNWKLVARRLRRYSVVAGDAITIPDFFSKRFHDDRNIVSTIAALIILVFFCVYVGSCFVTVGKLFSTLFGWDYHLTMVIGAAIVFAYTIIGGYLSVVVTDFIQGLLMFFALAVVFIGSVASAGGIDNTVAFLKGIPGFLDGTHVATPILNDAGEQIVKAGQAMFGAPADYGIITIISMLAWGLGYFGMPHILLRFMAIEDEKKLVLSRRIASVWVVIAMTASIAIRNRETCMLLFVFTSVPLLFLSGISWPGAAMPAFWKYFSYIFPSTFGINGYVRINSMGATLHEVSFEYQALWIQVGVYFLTTCLVYRWQILKSRKHVIEEYKRHKKQE